MAIELNRDNYETEVNQSDKPVLVDFWGPKCKPCLALMSSVEELKGVWRETEGGKAQRGRKPYVMRQTPCDGPADFPLLQRWRRGKAHERRGYYKRTNKRSD